MKFNSTITEDTLTPYLKGIKTRLYASKREIIYEIGEHFAMEGQSRAPEWHGNIIDSVGDPDLWQFFDEGESMRLDIVFTGLANDVQQWWTEFENPHFPKGGRDYALYQETGKDWYASPKNAKHKWFVKKSTIPTYNFAKKYLEEEIQRIMKL